MAGPAGAPVEWDADVTERVPNERLAWQSLPGSTVFHASEVRFEPTDDGGTHVHVRMRYTPPAGLVGHGVAGLFGADPKREMDEDLNRMKQLFTRRVVNRGLRNPTPRWRFPPLSRVLLTP